MSNKEYYAEARKRLDDKVSRFQIKDQLRIEGIYSNVPKLKELENELRKQMAEFTLFAFSRNSSEAEFEEYKNKNLLIQADIAELLAENGYELNATDHRHFCSKCNDLGYDSDTGEYCECFKKCLSEVMFERSNIGKDYKQKTLAKFVLDYYPEKDKETMSKYVEYANAYIRNFDRLNQNIIITGVPGCGKTFFSCAIGTELTSQGKYVIYSPVQDMVNVFNNQQFTKKDPEADTDSDRFSECDLLIIDDLGTEFRTQFSDSVLYSVINNRINMKKPIIINTNYDLEDLSGIYHDRLVSRLTYCFVNLIFPDVDIRKLLQAGKR